MPEALKGAVEVDEPGVLRALRAEVAGLRTRLAAAEQVATIVGWCCHDSTEPSKALTQAWMDWSHAYGSPEPSEEWHERIRTLAARRDEIRARTLESFRTRDSGSTESGGDTDAAP